MPKFLNWNKKLSRSSLGSGNANSDRHGGSRSAQVGDWLPETFERLHHICKSSASHPFVKPFGNMVSIVEQAVRDRPAPFPVGPAMHAVLEFLQQSLNPEARLKFPLVVTHSPAATRQFLGEVGGALAVLAEIEDHPGLSNAVKAMLEQWSVIGKTFTQRCQEVWELYIYVAFLDVKGDRTLMQQALDQFCELLDCSPRVLLSNLESSSSSAKTVLHGLAEREFQPILEKMHRRFLQGWHLSFEDQIREQHTKFRDTCFNTHVGKVEWADFLDAFQSYFAQSGLPTDVARQLRVTMDPALNHYITSLAWTELLQLHGSVQAVLEVVMGLVMENLPRSIYRSDEEIRSFDEQQRSMLDAGADDPDQGALGDCAQPDQVQVKRSKRHKDATNPYTSASADIVASDAKKISSLEDPSTIVTPADRLSNLNLALHKQMTGRKCRMTWEEYNALAQQKCLPWWQPQGQLSRDEQRTAEKLRVDAMRAVKSSVICTNRALILHVQTGSLGSDRPIVETRASPPKQAVPSLVVMANGLRQNGVATFGRGAARDVGLSPDYEMQEPIASRSHFAITYEQDTQQYCLRDTGSKWGTFLRIGSEGRELNCGDWIRAGVAEFVVRHCGGGCSCHKHHAQYRIQSLRLSRQYAGPQLRAVSAVVPRERPHFIDPDVSSDMSRAEELQDELALLFSRRGHCGWMTTSTHLCQSAASRSPRHFPKADEDSGHSRDSCGHNSDNASATVQLTSVPTTPMELEFLSGPRMGEKVVLWDRLCTLGRGEQNTIQPSAAVPLVGGETILAGTHEFKVEEVKAQTGQHCLPSVAATTLAEMCQASADTNIDSSC